MITILARSFGGVCLGVDESQRRLDSSAQRVLQLRTTVDRGSQTRVQRLDRAPGRKLYAGRVQAIRACRFDHASHLVMPVERSIGAISIALKSGRLLLAGAAGKGAFERHLGGRLVEVAVVISKSGADFTDVPAHQLDIIQRMGASLYLPAELPQLSGEIDLIIDGIIGYSLLGPPRSGVAQLIG